MQLDTSSTVHRLLQYKAAGSLKDAGDEEAVEGSYIFCRGNPLSANAVLIDEASMLDITLTAALLEALAPKTQLVLVGEEQIGSPRTIVFRHHGQSQPQTHVLGALRILPLALNVPCLAGLNWLKIMHISSISLLRQTST